MTDCVVCIRRDTDYTVCRSCRLRLAADLGDLPNLYALLPYALTRTNNPTQRVRGRSDIWPVPINLDVHDLQLPANAHSRTLHARGLLGIDEDQQGTLSIATILATWVVVWHHHRNTGENLPPATVWHLATWLRIRLDWACDNFDDIADFAHDIQPTATYARSLLGLQYRKEVLQGAACPTCDTRSLFRTLDPREGASDWIECGNCHRLWTDSEYDRLVTILAADNTRSVTT